jgi:alkylhydroperoxidase family enzyme
MDIRHAVGVKTGIPEAKLEALGAYADSPWFSERERAALAFCEAVIRDDREVSDACEARLRAYFSEAERVELTFIIGYQVFASKFAKAFRLPPQGFSGAAGQHPRRRAE